MALMKKLLTGGTTPYDQGTFENLINQKIGEYNLPMKGERNVRSKLRDLMTYMSDPSKKELKVDPVTQTYTLTGEGSDKFTGSPDEIKKNWLTGKLNLKDDNDVNSVAVAIYKSALDDLKSFQPKTEETTVQKARGIRELSDYMTNKAYGTAENFGHLRSQWKSDDVIKKETMLSAVKLIDEYKKGLGTQYDNLDANQKANIQSAYEAAKSNNWKKFENPARNLNWNIYQALLTPEEIGVQKEAQETASAQLNQKIEEQKANALAQAYSKAGFGTDDQQVLKDTGYSEVLSNWGASEGKPWIDKILASNGVTTLYNPQSKQKILVKDGKPWNSSITDQFNPQFGYAWENNLDTGLKFYKPGNYSGMKNTSWMRDPYQSKNIGRQLVAEGIPKGFRLFGWSNERNGQYNKDILGRRDFTKSLVLTDPNGRNIPLHFISGRYYGGPNGQYSISRPTGFVRTNDFVGINDYSQLFSSLGISKEKISDELPDQTPQQLYTILSNRQMTAKRNNQHLPTNDNFDRIARTLTYHILNTPSIRYNPALKQRYLDVVSNYVLAKENLNVPKNQQGGALNQLRAIANKRRASGYYTPGNAATPNGTNRSSVGYDAEGVFGEMSTKDKILTSLETAGDVASIAPGLVGTGGATLSFAAGLTKDLLDGDGQMNWKKHLTNLGFIGLSTIGLGAAKNAAKAAGLISKVAVDANKISNIAKIESKAARLEKTAEFKGLQKAVDKIWGFADRAGNIDIAKIEHAGQDVKDAYSLVKKAENVTAYTGKLGIAKELGAKTLTGTINAPGKILSSKFTKFGFAGLQGYGVLNAAGNIQRAREEAGDYSHVKTDDWLSLLTGAVSTRRIAKDLFDARLIKGVTVKSGKSVEPIKLKTTKTVDGKEVPTEIEFVPDINNFKPGLNPLARKKNFKEWLKSEAKAKNIDPALIDDIKEKDLNRLASKITGIDYDPNVIKGKPSAWNEYKHERTGKVLEKYGYKPTKVEPEEVKPSSNEIKEAEVGDIPESEIIVNPEFKPKTKPLLTPEELEAKRILPDSPLRTMYEKRQRSSVFGSNRGNPLLADNNRPISVPPITVKGKPLQVKSFEETESDIAKSVQKLGKAKTLGERRSLSRSLKGKPKKSGGIKKAKVGDTPEMEVAINPETKSESKLLKPEEFEKVSGEELTNDMIHHINKIKSLINGYNSFRVKTTKLLSEHYKLRSKPKNSVRKAITGIKVPTVYTPAYVFNSYAKFLEPAKVSTQNFSVAKPASSASGIIVKPNPRTPWLDNAEKQAIKTAIPEFLANSINYINTSLANKESADLQAKAYKESIVNLPLLNRIQYRSDAGSYLAEAARQKGILGSQYNRIANSIGDLDKSLAVKMEGVNKGSDITAKGYGLYKEAQQKTDAAQKSADYETMKTNLGIVGQNMKSAAQANAQIPIVYSKLALAQASNATNFNLGMLKLHSNIVQNTNTNRLFDIYNSDKYKTLQKSRTDWQEEYDKAKEASKARIDPNTQLAWDEEKDWVGSLEEKALILKRKKIDEQLDKYKDLYNTVGISRSFGVPINYVPSLSGYFKKGGSLDSESARAQAESERQEKELEMFYKVIMHNNEMLQKALTNIFK